MSSIIRYHHLHFDGKGYPTGLKGEEIPVGARIISVADSFDAMTSNRPYRPAMSAKDACKELQKHSGTQFDPKVVRAFVNYSVFSKANSLPDDDILNEVFEIMHRTQVCVKVS